MLQFKIHKFKFSLELHIYIAIFRNKRSPSDIFSYRVFLDIEHPASTLKQIRAARKATPRPLHQRPQVDNGRRGKILYRIYMSENYWKKQLMERYDIRTLLSLKYPIDKMYDLYCHWKDQTFIPDDRQKAFQSNGSRNGAPWNQKMYKQDFPDGGWRRIFY